MNKLLLILLTCFIYKSNSLCMELKTSSNSATKTILNNNQSPTEIQKFNRASIYKQLDIDLNKPTTETLEKLKLLLNVICLHNTIFNVFQDMRGIIPALYKYQDFRSFDGNFCKAFAAFGIDDGEIVDKIPLKYRTISAQEAIEKLGKFSKNFKNIKADSFIIQTYTLPGYTASLQLNNRLINPVVGRKDTLAIAKKFIESSHEEVKLYGGFTMHFLLSSSYLRSYHKIPCSITAMNREERDKPEKLLLEALAITNPNEVFKTYFTKTFLQFPEIINLIWVMHRISLQYFKNGGEDPYSIYITPETIKLMESHENIAANVLKHSKDIETLYSQIDADVSNLRKKIKKLPISQLITYKQKIESIFAYKNDVELNLKNTNHEYKKAIDELDFFNLPPKISYLEKPFDFEAELSDAQIAKKEVAKIAKEKPKNTNKSKKKNLQGKTVSENSKLEIEPIAEIKDSNKIAELPIVNYDSRILNWFDMEKPSKNSSNYNSFLYHTFTTLIDPYLIEYGIQSDYENKKRNQIDTCYSLPAVIKFKDKTAKTVLLSISLGQHDNTCYHRELKEKNIMDIQSEYFENNYWTVFFDEENFPELGKPVEPRKLNNKNDVVISEDEFCIKIYDALHDAEITLIKPNAS